MPRRSGRAPGRHVEVARAAADAGRRDRQPWRAGDAADRAGSHAARGGSGIGAGQGRRAPADRVVQGAGPRRRGQHGQAFRGQADRDADQRQCRRRARRLWRGGGDRDGGDLPGRNARDQRPRDRCLWRAGLSRRRADRRVRPAGRRGRGGGALVRLLDAEGALSARGQEGDGARAGRAAGLASCPMRSSIRPAAAPA